MSDFQNIFNVLLRFEEKYNFENFKLHLNIVHFYHLKIYILCFIFNESRYLRRNFIMNRIFTYGEILQ